MSLHVQSGDRILLCSDGLSNELEPDRLATLAGAPVSLEEAVTNLVHAAKEAGGRDNISAVLLEFDEAHEPSRVINTTMASAPPPVAPTESGRARRGPRFTWRVVAGAIVLGAVVWAFFFIVHWYAYSTYYLGSDGKYIGIYEGQPHGVLWYKPKLLSETTYLVTHLQASAQISIKETVSEPSVASALSYAHYLYGLWATTKRSSVPTTTTTAAGTFSTTTTVRATTTTVKSKG